MPQGTYVGAISDDCSCKVVNHSDHEGWYITRRNPACPDHGNAED